VHVRGAQGQIVQPCPKACSHELGRLRPHSGVPAHSPLTSEPVLQGQWLLCVAVQWGLALSRRGQSCRFGHKLCSWFTAAL
jgi:hypothetical protein